MALIHILVAIVLFLSAMAGGDDPTDDPDCAVDGSDGCLLVDPNLPDPSTAAPDWEPVQVNGVYGVILPARNGEDFLIDAEEFWTPDEVHVERAEFALEAN